MKRRTITPTVARAMMRLRLCMPRDCRPTLRWEPRQRAVTAVIVTRGVAHYLIVPLRVALDIPAPVLIDQICKALTECRAQGTRIHDSQV